MSTIQDLIKQMEEWPVSVLVVVTLNFIGVAIKRSETVPNRVIPMCLMMLGASIYMSVGDLDSISVTCRNPIVVLALYGTLLGVLSWMAHNIIWKQIVKRFPALQNGDGDTEIIRKPKDDEKP